MHDLWYRFSQASMNISSERAEQDRLVVQMLYVREVGVLTRKEENMEIIQEAVTRDGKIYRDLPFLAGDMTDYWIRESASMSADQRLNFSSFLAKLSAVGIAEDNLCDCALIVFRDTLESTRRLDKAIPGPASASEREDHQVGQDDYRTSDTLSIAKLLPAANAWIFHAAYKIIQPSEHSVTVSQSMSRCWVSWHELKVLYPKTVDLARRVGYFR
jgi:hypothetical protein